MDRFTRANLQSLSFILDSAATPKIKMGETSNSDNLNRYFKALGNDMTTLATRSDLLAARSLRVESAASTESNCALTTLQGLQVSVDSIATSGEVLCDMHDNFYLNTGSTTADVSHLFGQATLPIKSSTDLLLQENVYGDKYISPEVELSYAITNGTPSNAEYLTDSEALYMLKEEQLWINSPTSDTIYVKLKIPVDFKGLPPNVLEIYPCPAFGMDLLEVAYQETGLSSTSAWTPLDLSYLFGYNSGNGKVEKFTPVRLHLPGTSLSQVRIKMKASSGSVAWGFHKLKIRNNQYEANGTLVVKNPYGNTPTNILIRGKDQNTLNGLTKSIGGVNATITLTSNNIYSTPVISGIILQN